MYRIIIIFNSFGSNKNLGPLKPLDILKKAIAELKQSEISLVSLSRFFESLHILRERV